MAYYAQPGNAQTFQAGGGSAYEAKRAGAGLQQLVSNYNQAYNEAKTANEARYQQALGILNQNTGQRLSDIRSDAGGERARVFQSLARSGLGGSSVGNVESAGITRRMNEELNRTSDALAGSKVGLIERRQDPYPDQGSLATLLTGALSGFGQQGLGALTSLLGGLKF
jgi:hypothetical protein